MFEFDQHLTTTPMMKYMKKIEVRDSSDVTTIRGEKCLTLTISNMCLLDLMTKSPQKQDALT